MRLEHVAFTGAGIDKDRADFSRRVVGVNFPFRVLSGRTRVREVRGERIGSARLSG